MKKLNVIEIEKEIKNFQKEKNIKLNCSPWDLAEFIIDTYKKDLEIEEVD